MSKTVTIKSPVKDFSGRVGPVRFADGEGKLDVEKHGHLRDWFRRKGYTVGSSTSSKVEGGQSEERSQGGPNDDPGETPFEDRPLQELREIGVRRNIPGASRMSKANLVKALEGSQTPTVEGSAKRAAAVEDTLGTPTPTTKGARVVAKKTTARKTSARKSTARKGR